MKKEISLTIILVLLILVYQFLAGMLKNSHETDYLIEKDNNKFNIVEKLENNKYYFTVDNNDYNYVFSIDNQFGKRKEVITDILVTSDNSMQCIYPIYQDKIYGNIICNDKSNIYAYESVKNKDLVVKFVNYLKENNYNSTSFEEEKYTSPSNYSGISAYEDYIDEVIAMWSYRGITVINNRTGYTNELLSFDRYENTLGTTVGKYFVMPNYINNNLFEIDGFYIINLIANDQDLVKLDFIMSDKSYINGVVDNKIYIFDKNNMKQIEINVKKKEINVVSTSDIAKYYDNGWVDRNIYDFKNSEIKFNSINKEDVSNYNINNVYQSDDSYFIYENNTMYQVYKNNLDKRIVLFYGNGLKEIQVIKNNIYYISENTLYRYNDKYSIKKLLTYSELNYNYKNIVNIYK